MQVTEIGILHCLGGKVTPEIRTLLEQALPKQVQWRQDNVPDSPLGTEALATWVFQQREDPSVMLFTATWESVEAHTRWIQSEVNQKLMGDLTKHIVLEGDEALVLFHLDKEIFSGPQEPGSVPLLESPVLSLGRFFVAKEEREVFAKKFAEVEHVNRDFVRPHQARSGWRVDKEAEEREEFVLISGFESIDRQAELAGSKDSAKYCEIQALIEDSDTKHYQRII